MQLVEGYYIYGMKFLFIFDIVMLVIKVVQKLNSGFFNIKEDKSVDNIYCCLYVLFIFF